MREAVSWMSGRLVSGEPTSTWTGAVLDSRRVEGGELFFALPGEQADGHRFVADALERGAAAVVVHQPVELAPSDAVIEVDDTYRALHALTRALRSRAPRRLVAITGSAGKTSTKDLLAALLGRVHRVAKSPGNLNNLYGFPLALLGIAADTEWMVAEMGMSTPGELGGVSRLGRPDVAVFTNVRPVHLEQLGSIEAVAKAKAEMLEGLSDDGVVIANADDPWVRWIASRHAGRVVTFGRAEDADYRVVSAEPLGDGRVGSTLELFVPGEGQVEVTLPLHGSYAVDNFLAAAATAHHLGVDWAEIAAGADSLRPAPGRGIVRELPGDARVIDDSYNSNPDALALALESAAALAGHSRRWAVLGDMLELGPEAADYHREAGRRAAALGFSPVLGVGELSRELVRAAADAGAEATWVATAAEAAEIALGTLREGDLVLVKGSRGIALETVVGALAGDSS